MKVDNAIIMAAGTASRFAPISYEKPKALVNVRGEVLIERQIKQLREVGIDEIVVITGYKSEQFDYLKEKFGVILLRNEQYLTKNNHSSLYTARSYLKNSYICSSDNYFIKNPFEEEVDDSYYASVFVSGETNEWCINESGGWIKDVTIGGKDSWIMLGQVFFSEAFSEKFVSILEQEYGKEETANKLWEEIYLDYIDDLPLKIRKFPSDFIFEFDTIEELEQFDECYKFNKGSSILADCAQKLQIEEKDIKDIRAFKDDNNLATGFTFWANKRYRYVYATGELEEDL